MTFDRPDMSPADRAAVLFAADAEQRPRTRGDCLDGPRPCPWLSCQHHLLAVAADGHLPALRVLAGARYIRAGSLPPLSETQAEAAAEHALQRLEQMGQSCVLDIADAGPHTLEEVGELLGVTRERIRQVETQGLSRLRESTLRCDVVGS